MPSEEHLGWGVQQEAADVIEPEPCSRQAGQITAPPSPAAGFFFGLRLLALMTVKLRRLYDIFNGSYQR
jgi:hypothetical protein